MTTQKSLQNIREVHEKLTGQANHKLRVYKVQYPAISLDSSGVTMIAKFLEKHEKELIIISQERKLLALMNKHENFESYPLTIPPEVDKIVLFYKLAYSYVPKEKIKKSDYSFWDSLGNYIQDLKFSDDRYYAQQIPIMLKLLRKGMVQTYENQKIKLKKPHLESILSGMETDYEKILYFLRQLKGITGITSVQTYLSEQFLEILTGLKDRIREENERLKKFLQIPIDYSSNDSLIVLFENLSKLKVRYQQSSTGILSAFSKPKINMEKQRLSQQVSQLQQKENKIKELEYLLKQKSQSLDQSNKLIQQLKERLNNQFAQKEQMKRQIQKFERFKKNLQEHLSLKEGSLDEIEMQIKNKFTTYEKFNIGLGEYFEIKSSSMEELQQKIKKIAQQMKEERDVFLNQFQSTFGQANKKIDFQFIKEFNAKYQERGRILEEQMKVMQRRLKDYEEETVKLKKENNQLILVMEELKEKMNKKGVKRRDNQKIQYLTNKFKQEVELSSQRFTKELEELQNEDIEENMEEEEEQKEK